MIERAVGPNRILEFSRDPLFKSVYPDRTSWVQIGRPLEPHGRLSGYPDQDRVSLPRAMMGLNRRRYDFVIFPSLRPWGPGDPHEPIRAFLRSALLKLSGNRVVPRILETLFSLPELTYIIRDVSDVPDIDDFGLGVLRDAVAYSKREVLESDLDPVRENLPVVYTPMPIDVSVYDQVNLTVKTTDVFYAARPNSSLRRQAMDVVTRLASEGLAVDVPSGRIEFAEYLERLARARLVVSPRGNGEHCWRHYEALLVGSVPVINIPLRPVHYELRHGETCFFYKPTEEDLRQQILEGLSDTERLREIARAGGDLVRATHSKEAVCRLLLDRAGFGFSPGVVRRKQ